MFENWIPGGPRQPSNDGGVVDVQDVAVWQRAGPFEGVRWSHQEKSDRHLLHHFRKPRRACEQETFWCAVRGGSPEEQKPCLNLGIREESTIRGKNKPL